MAGLSKIKSNRVNEIIVSANSGRGKEEKEGKQCTRSARTESQRHHLVRQSSVRNISPSPSGSVATSEVETDEEMEVRLGACASDRRDA